MNKKLKKLFLLFIISTLAIGITAQTQSTKSPEKFTVILDWFVNPDHAPLFVAQQQGYYQQAGLDVNFIAPADPADPPKLVAAGKADIAIDYQPHVLLEISQDLPIVQVGSLVDKPLSCLAVLANGPIKNIKDLKGKTVGYSVGGTDSAMLKGMLLHNGLTMNDVTMIDVKYGLAQALLSKKVDAVIGVMRNFELIQFALLKHPARAFYPEENGVPPYDELVFIANRNTHNDPRIKGFLSAVAQGRQYLINHPEETWQAFAKAHPELNNELNHRAWLATIPYFATNPAAVDTEKCKQLAIYLNKTMDAQISPQACQS